MVFYVMKIQYEIKNKFIHVNISDKDKLRNRILVLFLSVRRSSVTITTLCTGITIISPLKLTVAVSLFCFSISRIRRNIKRKCVCDLFVNKPSKSIQNRINPRSNK